MINVPITDAPTLAALYAQLVDGQEAAHGPDYTTHHAIILSKQSPSCRSYCEIGVNQGATLACAILAGFHRVTGIDINLTPVLQFGTLFAQCATLIEQDHLAPLPAPVDFLFLDCDHTAPGLHKELKAHGDMVRRFILIHDTAAQPELHVTACVYATAHDWTVAGRDTRGHGWTLLSRNP